MLKYILGSIVAVILVIGVALAILIPKLLPWAEREIRDAVHRECPSCEFGMGGVTAWFDGLSVSDLHLAGGERGGQWVDFKARRITFSVDYTSLMSDAPRLKGVTLDHPDITFYDGEKSSQRSSGSLDSDKIIINAIFFFGGKFTYVRDVKGTHAVLVIDSIDGDIDPNPDRAIADVRAKIGSDGGFNLRVISPYNKRPLQIDTELEVKDQSLEALSEFFKPNAGVELIGTITKGHARTRLRGDHVSAALFAEYKDFKLRVNKMYDRNSVQTFFTNLGAAIAMREKNKNASAKDKESSVDLTREKGESIVSFILRGLKEAALKVAI